MRLPLTYIDPKPLPAFAKFSSRETETGLCSSTFAKLSLCCLMACERKQVGITLSKFQFILPAEILFPFGGVCLCWRLFT